eukprot:232778_1
MSSSQIIWKALITYLRVNDHVDGKLYQVLNQIGVLLIGYGCVFARCSVLWYTVKFQQSQQNLLFNKLFVPLRELDETTYALNYIAPDPSQQTSSGNTFLYNNEKKMSNPIHAFAWFQSLYVLLNFIGASFTHSLRQ